MDVDLYTRFSVWVSFCEIYNENIHDLLEQPSSTGTRRVNLRLCQDTKGNSFIKGTTLQYSTVLTQLPLTAQWRWSTLQHCTVYLHITADLYSAINHTLPGHFNRNLFLAAGVEPDVVFSLSVAC